MATKARPTHWTGVDSKEDWPETGCPIDWEFLDGLKDKDPSLDHGSAIYNFLGDQAMEIMNEPEEDREDDWSQDVSWLACHALAALNYINPVV